MGFSQHDREHGHAQRPAEVTDESGPQADAVEEVGFELAAVAEAGNGEKTDDARHETARAT
jgi:hypothetical protein